MAKRSIMWLKWSDPLAHLIDKHKEDSDDKLESARNSYLTDDDNYYKFNEDSRGQTGPALLGPNGIIPLQESTLPGKLYNFWVGHTNFGITNDIRDQIAAVEGVETLDIFTRYRFRMSVGKNFEQEAVKAAVEQKIAPADPKLLDLSKVEQMKVILKNKYPYWIIYTMSDNRLEVSTGKSKEEAMNNGSRFNSRAKSKIISWE